MSGNEGMPESTLGKSHTLSRFRHRYTQPHRNHAARGAGRSPVQRDTGERAFAGDRRDALRAVRPESDEVNELAGRVGAYRTG